MIALVLALAPVFFLNSAHASLVDQLEAELNSPDHPPVVTVHLKVGRRSLDIGGTLEFVGLPDLPDYFGLRDPAGHVHLFKADPARLDVTVGTASAGALLSGGYTHLLEYPADFDRLLKNELARGHLAAAGFGRIVDHATYLIDKLPMIQFILWSGSAVAVMTYFVALDSASELYIGRVGPRVIMDHWSSFVGSVAMVSSAVVYQPKSEMKKRLVTLALAGGATAFHFVIENPLHLSGLRAIRFNVQDPVDFWTGAVAAFGTALVPDGLAVMDRVRRRISKHAQRRMCRRELGKKEGGT